MRVVVVTKESTDYARRVEEFLENFARQTGREIETLNPETPDGTTFCRTYDIVEYPTVIALSDDGQVQNVWRGVNFPTINELSYYV